MAFVAYTFWGLLGAAVYIYVLYPLMVRLLILIAQATGSIFKDEDDSSEEETSESNADQRPIVSLVFYSLNEETAIHQQLQNALQTSYPGDRLEIIMGCDGNQQLTADLVRAFDDSRVRVVESEETRGKPTMLNACVEEAKGEIIVFSETGSCLEQNGLQQIVEHFVDPGLGCVYGKLVTIDTVTRETVINCNDRLSDILKTWESEAGMLPGMNGPYYAFRKELFTPLPEKPGHDGFLVGMQAQRAGARLKYDANLVIHREGALEFDFSFSHAVKGTIARLRELVGMLLLMQIPRGRSVIAFCSNTVLQRLGPIVLLLAFLANAALSVERFYLRVLSLHLLGYMAVGFLFWLMNPEQQDLRYHVAEIAFKIQSILFSILNYRKKQTIDEHPSQGDTTSQEETVHPPDEQVSEEVITGIS